MKTTCEQIKVRGCSIVCTDNPEWGTFGVMEDNGQWYNIHGKAGGRVLSHDEANRFWHVVGGIQ